MNTLIRNAHVLTMDAANTAVPCGCVAVEGAKTVYVGAEAGLPAAFRADETIDARGGVLMPGFVNAHTHLAMTLLRGYGSGLNLQDWLEKKIWPAEDKLTAQDCYWGSMLGLAEMIRSGTTAFLDMYMFMDETARAVEEAGIRAVLSRGIIGNSPGFAKALAENEALYRNWNGAANGRITVMLGPHAEYTCNESSLRQVVELSHKLGCGLHIHVQETRSETDACRGRHGMSPAKWLESLGLFTRPTVAAHCVTVDEDDIAVLARNHVSVAHCPGSNSKLASGIAPVVALRRAGVNVAVGTDGASSNNNLDMLEEARLAALLAKLKDGDPVQPGDAEALRMATIYGAAALGIDSSAGSIEVGKDADIIIISKDVAPMRPDIDTVSNVLYSAGAADITLTMARGRVLMVNSQLRFLDLERILHETEKISARICG